MFHFHTNLSNRHKKIMNFFAEKETYGNRRKVLEKALELLEASGDSSIEEILLSYKIQRSLFELSDFVLVNRWVLDGLVMIVTGRLTFNKFLNQLAKKTKSGVNTGMTVFSMMKEKSFSTIKDLMMFYKKNFNILSAISVDEDQKQISVRLNVFNQTPEIALIDLNSILEASGNTYSIKLEGGVTPVIIVKWFPPEKDDEVKKQREKYIKEKQEILISKTMTRFLIK